MSKSSNIISRFNFQGKLRKISYQQQQIKYLQLETEQGRYWLKIPQKLRKQLASLAPGCQLEVKGKVKQHSATGKTKYKAKTIAIVAPPSIVTSLPGTTKKVSLLTLVESKTQAKSKSKAKVLICQKSNCWKKGGHQVCKAIESVLSDQGLTKEIPLKKTGCLKQCKKAPALVMMPDKVCYNKVKAKQVTELVEQHLIEH